MRRFGYVLAVLLLPAALVIVSGCGTSGTDTTKKTKGSSRVKKDKNGEPEVEFAALEVKEYGTLKGKVVYDGTPPAPMEIPDLKTKDKETCHDTAPPDQKVYQTWIVDKDTKGVKDVVIFLKPPENKYFVPKDDQKKVSEPVVLDQPHCVYLPNTLVHYPAYRKGPDELERTGQVLVVKNSAPILHNTKIQGDAVAGNRLQSHTLKPSSEEKINNINPQDTPLQISCDVHGWMKAYLWAFDHPYFAKTNEKGEFSIPNVPAGTEVSVVVWHAGLPGNYLNRDEFKGQQGRPMTFKTGDNTLEIKIAQ